MTEFVRGTTLTPQQVYRPHFVYSAWDERHPDASAQVRRWIALQDARDERLARNVA